MATGKGGFRLDSDPFMGFLKKLAKQINAPMGQVIENECLKILQKSGKDVGRTTKAAAGGKYNPASKNFKGWVRMNGKFYYVGPGTGGKSAFRYGGGMWAMLQSRLAAERKRAETRVALSKALFYRTAAELKLKSYSVGWNEAGELKRAYLKSGGLGKSGKQGPIWSKSNVVYTSKNLRGLSPYLKFTLSSTNTFNPFTKGAGKVQKAMNGRIAYFKVATKLAAVRKGQKVAAMGGYKNIKVK